MEAAYENNARMSIREYFDTIFSIMRSPGRFFAKAAGETGAKRSLFFLMISALFYCSVSMAYFFENSLSMGVIMMANAVLMPAFGALVTFILLGMTGWARLSYARVFIVYAYASGAVMVISWIPGLAIVMEPVRALLVGIGLIKIAEVGKLKAASLVLMTAFMVLLFFWSAAPLVAELQKAL